MKVELRKRYTWDHFFMLGRKVDSVHTCSLCGEENIKYNCGTCIRYVNCENEICYSTLKFDCGCVFHRECFVNLIKENNLDKFEDAYYLSLIYGLCPACETVNFGSCLFFSINDVLQLMGVIRNRFAGKNDLLIIRDYQNDSIEYKNEQDYCSPHIRYHMNSIKLYSNRHVNIVSVSDDDRGKLKTKHKKYLKTFKKDYRTGKLIDKEQFMT